MEEGLPYDTKLSRKAYEKEKRALQIELLKSQLWAKSTGQKILIIFEGRDADQVRAAPSSASPST